MRRIFITGGHFAPAAAVIPKFKASGWEIYYVGRKYAMEGEAAEALEYREIKATKFLVITTGRLQRKFFINIGQSIKAILKIPVGFAQSFWWLIRYRPNAVLSFGGYVAVPVVVIAKILGVPVATHEQTKSLGLANRIIRLVGAKVLAVGNPLREEILAAHPTLTDTIYITGGNQGAHVLNLAVAQIVSQLVKKFTVVHQTGDSSYHDFEKARKLKNYHVRKFLTGEEAAGALASAKIIVSRAGANTVDEIAYLGKPAVLVPIPWASGNEQMKNAQELSGLGMAEIIPQEKLSGISLLAAIEKIAQNYKIFYKKAQRGKNLVHPEAAEKIVDEVEKMVEFKSES